MQNALDHPYVPASIAIDDAKLVHFKNAIPRGYSDLNNDECVFAEALDKTKRVWCRNPSKGSFSIPLLNLGLGSDGRPLNVIALLAYGERAENVDFYLLPGIAFAPHWKGTFEHL